VTLVLASTSPRRRELLALLGVPFRVIAPAGVDETPRDGESPRDVARRLAVDKARSVDGDPVLAADTVVELDGTILGKPVDVEDARRMLQRLSGRTHLVHTGVAARSGERTELEVVTTSVGFVPLTADAIGWYLATGEPFDKAGAYAIQGAGGVFVEGVEGSVSNVVGLPLHAVVELLRRMEPVVSTLGGRLLTPPPGAYDWHSHRPSANQTRPESESRDTPMEAAPKMNLKPLEDRIVVKPNEAEERTASGLVIPDTAKEKPQQGKVLAVGPGKRAENTGELIPLGIEVDQTVLYSKYGGTEVTVEGDDLLILSSRDVLAIVEA
jgi:nucleoside triphosphate pyrophosphatase